MTVNMAKQELRPIIVYDGVCHLCNGSLSFVIRHQRSPHTFYFVPFQSDDGRFICEHYSIAPDAMSTFLYIERGHLKTESSAWLRIMIQLSCGWRIVGRLASLVPAPLRDFSYRLIGRHRYRWFGNSDVCLLPRGQKIDDVPDRQTIESILKLPDVC
ncbi:MAG: putative DCC family thiol-disulfide oxidoreductase YuxK [Gammaproteobacteria bacterium]|jgi:predicted DCC family thiol-disulfide oxidoreductase YuxK